MLYCSRCGSTNADSAKACISCGEPLIPTPVVPSGGASSGNPMGPPMGPSMGSSMHEYSGAPATTYLVQSILVTLFCCQPFGVVAIVFAAMTMGKNSSGDFAAAERTSGLAKMWCWIGFGVGLAFILLYIAFMVFAGGMTAMAPPGP
jgi:hypothetical protein